MELKRLGITPKKEAQFNKKGIFTVEDLLDFRPRKYNDFSRETGLLADSNETSCFIFTLKSLFNSSYGSRIPFLQAVGEEYRTKQPVRITWFHQRYLFDKFQPFIGRQFFVAGTVNWNQQYQNYSVTAPALFEPMGQKAQRIYPVYSKIQGMSDDYLTEKISGAFSFPEATAETLPYDVVAAHQLLSRREALYQIHCPITMEQVQTGEKRMLFDDMVYFALHNEWAKRASTPGSPFSIITLEKYNLLKNSLPYQLTDDQEKTVTAMIHDIQEGRRLNALVQGDVGCGKTIISMLLMAAMADNGYQSVLMAPTQVLAEQHYRDISTVMAGIGLHVVQLSNTMRAAEKKKALAEIRSGEADIIVGTHAVIGKSVEYHCLGLTVVDEEHKFGVAQRATLSQKAGAGVHSISMSATPIPRTLASVIYGETLQLYNIHTMPQGRKPVITGMETTKQKLAAFILKEKNLGHQTYVVCPLIDSSDDDVMDGVKSVEEVTKEYTDILSPYGVTVKSLTGKDSKADTTATLEQFRKGEIDVLVATTIVEVGVNVPTATMMVISNAERFGLASLHQLRGRVGRSDLQAYCVLCPNRQKELSEVSQKRLSIMCETTDGFEIAEADLKLRGAGDFLGTKQSGDNKYMTLMMLHPEVYEEARSVARALLDSGDNCRMVRKVREEREELTKGN